MFNQNQPSEPYQPLGGMQEPGLQPQTDNDKLMAALCYVFSIVMSVIILATDMKNKPFLKYHAYQSLIFGIALFIIYSILGFTVVGLCLAPLLFLGQLYYAYVAYTKGIFTIPLVTDLTANAFKDFPAPPKNTP